jgi:hypothetical protein
MRWERNARKLEDGAGYETDHSLPTEEKGVLKSGA